MICNPSSKIAGDPPQCLEVSSISGSVKHMAITALVNVVAANALKTQYTLNEQSRTCVCVCFLLAMPSDLCNFLSGAPNA